MLSKTVGGKVNMQSVTMEKLLPNVIFALTPWSGVLFEKLVKKFPASY
jgi:hypothetical protein